MCRLANIVYRITLYTPPLLHAKKGGGRREGGPRGTGALRDETLRSCKSRL